MYTVDVKVTGIAPLMQHRFPMPDFENMGKGGKRVSGKVDYSEEWRQSLYTNSEGIFQPAVHFEGAMVKAGASFKVQGRRGMSYKELIKANVFVTPDEIPFGVPVPDKLDTDADKPLYLDMRPVVVQRARVVRLRPTFKSGWSLEFSIEVLDDQIPYEMLQDILSYAGKTVGIGDFRPRFGRFNVSRFEVSK